MNLTGPVFLRLFAAGLLSLPASLVGAQVPLPPSKNEETVPDVMAMAKRDLETIKAVRETATQPKATLPQFEKPGLPASMSKPPVWVAPASSPKRKVNNWLLEAMEKPELRKNREATSAKTHDLARRDNLNGELARNTDGRESATGRLDGREANMAGTKDQARDEKNRNPLAAYMASWMTPRDYALLQPSVAGLTAAELTARGEPSGEFALPSLVGRSGSLSSNASFSPVESQVAFFHTRENPFLAKSPETPVATSGVTIPLRVPVPRTAIPPAPVSPVIEMPITRPIGPEFARPSTDEKYFKQLKRF